jgi:NADH-quinone oxidoreductase subunit N
MITQADLFLLSPHIILASASLIVMLSIAIKRNYLLVNILTLSLLLIAFLAVLPINNPIAENVGTLFIVDGFSRLFMALILAGSFIIVLVSYSYLKNKQTVKEEYFILLLLSTLGALSIVISKHFISFFISLELLSVSLYALIAYLKEEETAIEAGVKYLILAAVSTSFLLFGVALLYSQTGSLTLDFEAINLSGKQILIPPFLGGLAFIMVGILFKLGLVPFHLWTSDVYVGASPPIAAFISTVSKGSVFAFLLRLFFQIESFKGNSVWIVFATVAIASMLIGNWLALKEKNIRRLLAYSSIAHLGYLLVAFLAASRLGNQAAVFYLIAYFITMIGSFAVVTVLSEKGKEAEEIEDYKGLFQEKPWLATFFTAMLLSLASVPLTAGFVANFYLLKAGVDAGLWLTLIVLVLSSILGLFYYLRVIIALFSTNEENTMPPSLISRVSIPSKIALLVLFIALIALGLFPNGLVHIIESVY